MILVKGLHDLVSGGSDEIFLSFRILILAASKSAALMCENLAELELEIVSDTCLGIFLPDHEKQLTVIVS